MQNYLSEPEGKCLTGKVKSVHNYETLEDYFVFLLSSMNVTNALLLKELLDM